MKTYYIGNYYNNVSKDDFYKKLHCFDPEAKDYSYLSVNPGVLLRFYTFNNKKYLYVTTNDFELLKEI